MDLPLLHNPATGASRAHILLVHGLGEHQGRYDEVVRRLNFWGFGCWRYDQRGHGQAPGRRGDAPQVHTLLADLAQAIDRVRAQTLGLPLVLLGHSLGGLVAARTVAGALRGEPFGRVPDALVLSSPALDPGMTSGQRALLALGRRLFPHLAVSNGLQPAWISRDPAVVQAYVQDPQVHDRVTATVAALVADGGAEVIDDAARWQVPTLLMWAGADRCVTPQGSARFAAAAPSDRVTQRCFDGLFHELFNEPEHEQVFALLRDWLNERFPS
ncbi:alpha/beta hydrolase [Inhella gelatinilytica]|uniref:Lysophospholipase n=1 Tax=Inhella gelatinilytica TaxID=2795030 RepID=A0A931NCP3_9BURK|nr:alpha/beta hydrolase [Inhella gelatinilytica]MBH9551749.1 lysophospholipase [Inhella gelatinilytica]